MSSEQIRSKVQNGTAARCAQTLIHVSWEQTNLLAYLRFGFFFVQLICMFWMTALVVQHCI